jgi:hypothetical protein
VECSIAGIIDRVDALETIVPSMDQDKLSDKTHEVVYDGEEEVEDEEPFNPPRPPPHWQHRDDQEGHQELPHPPRQPNWQGMGGHPHRGPNHSTLAVMMILLIKLSLRFLPSMVCMMLKLI